MILGLDVGNTNIVVGVIDNGEIVWKARLGSDRDKTTDEHAIDLKILLDVNGVSADDISGAIISSVVPPVTNALKEAIEKITKKVPLVVGPGIRTGLNILMDQPSQVGSDRIVNAVAAIQFYNVPMAIFDMGTATTCCVIDEKKNYIGGLIYPGMKISEEALSSKASQLPYISYDAPDKIIGKNTIDCMKSGMVYGNAAMIDGVIERIEEELGQKVTVIATGGLSSSIIDLCKKDIIYDDDLLLKGLGIIYNKNR